jgi:hypothetical protein
VLAIAEDNRRYWQDRNRDRPARVAFPATYPDACAVGLVEIVLDLESYRGAGRIYIP